MSANDSESPLAKVGHRQAPHSEALVHPYKGFLAFIRDNFLLRRVTW